jgi:hypothetical protein
MQNEQTENGSTFTCSLPHIENEDSFSTIVDYLKNGYFISAHQTYRLLTGLSLEESFGLLQSFWQEAQLAHIDPTTYPRWCCYNCIGVCGNKPKLIAEYGNKLYRINAGEPLGTACGEFMDIKQIRDTIAANKEASGIRLTPNDSFLRANPDCVTYDDTILALDSNVILTQTKKINRSSSRCQEESEVFIVKRSKEETFDKFIELITEKCNLQYHVIQRYFHVEVVKNGIKPHSGETREEYIRRLNQKLRDQRNELFEAVNAMSYDELRKKVQDYLSQQNISGVLDQFGDFDLFVQNFFPGMSMKEIVIQLTQEG